MFHTDKWTTGEHDVPVPRKGLARSAWVSQVWGSPFCSTARCVPDKNSENSSGKRKQHKNIPNHLVSSQEKARDREAEPDDECAWLHVGVV